MRVKNFTHPFAALTIISLLVCGTGIVDGAPTQPSVARTGSVVYVDVAKINGRLERAVHVLNLATRKVHLFQTDDFIKGGASVSKNGLIAQGFDRGRDEEIIKINKLDGTFVNQFVFSEPYSSATSGARISPDGALVAFSLRVILGGGKSEERIYFCGTAADNRCFYYANLGDPEWMPNGRLIAVNVFPDGTRGGLYATDGAPRVGDTVPTDVNRIGPEDLINATAPAVTPDGKKIIVGLGVRQNIYAVDIVTGAVQQLTKDGLEQYTPLVSGDGKVLFYVQQCCPSSPTAPASGSVLHAVALNLNAVTSTPSNVNYISNTSGTPIDASTRYGYTPMMLP